jgi:Aspartyl protease
VRFDFVEVPGSGSTLSRPALPVRVEDLTEGPLLCLVDTGSTANRFGVEVAEAVGIDLHGSPTDIVATAGIRVTAYHARVDVTIAGTRYDAPVTFCDPWPFAFGLLGQEGFLRFFRVTLCAKDLWLDVEPESH